MDVPIGGSRQIQISVGNPLFNVGALKAASLENSDHHTDSKSLHENPIVAAELHLARCRLPGTLTPCQLWAEGLGEGYNLFLSVLSMSAFTKAITGLLSPQRSLGIRAQASGTAPHPALGCRLSFTRFIYHFHRLQHKL